MDPIERIASQLPDTAPSWLAELIFRDSGASQATHPASVARRVYAILREAAILHCDRFPEADGYYKHGLRTINGDAMLDAIGQAVVASGYAPMDLKRRELPWAELIERFLA